MTIRIICAECASVLKIKDELAGTSARCPKCKTKFLIPGKNTPEETPELEIVSSQAQISAAASPTASTDQQSSAPSADDPLPSPTDGDVLPTDPDSHNDFEHAAASDLRRQNGPAIADWDDDDLDSPPVLVNVPGSEPISDSTPQALEIDLAPRESKKKRGENQVFEAALQTEANQAKNSRAKPKKNSDQGFDPVQFLMDDSPSHRENPFSSNLQDDSDLSLPDDSDHDQFSRPTPIPLRKSSPSASTARPTPEKIDLASAAKMMKKAIKDAQFDSNRQRQRDEKSGYDYFQFFREIGLRGLGIILGCILAVTGAIWLGNYTFSSTLKTPPLGMVRGVVKLNGQPVSNAVVYFSPRKPLEQLSIKGSKRDRERTSVGVSNANGQYKMMYSMDDRIEGVAVGKCHVWVTHVGPTGNDVPVQWSEVTMNEMEVKSGSQVIDILMESAPGK